MIIWTFVSGNSVGDFFDVSVFSDLLGFLHVIGLLVSWTLMSSLFLGTLRSSTSNTLSTVVGSHGLLSSVVFRTSIASTSFLGTSVGRILFFASGAQRRLLSTSSISFRGVHSWLVFSIDFLVVS